MEAGSAGSQSLLAPASDIELLKEMSALLRKEGNTLADMPGLLGLDPTVPGLGAAGSPNVRANALEQALEKVV